MYYNHNEWAAFCRKEFIIYYGRDTTQWPNWVDGAIYDISKFMSSSYQFASLSPKDTLAHISSCVLPHLKDDNNV